jgi:protease I
MGQWKESKMSTLSGLRVAILVADGFEQVEMTEPRKALQEAGADTRIVSPARRQVQGWNHHDKADRFDVDVALDDAVADEFGALLLPGGVANPDQLRTLPQAVEFVREFVQAGKPVAVICHGPWTLIEADVVKGRNMTSWPSVKTDLLNAGAHWTDQEVVVDRGFVSSRKPADLPAFNKAMIAEFAKGSQPRAKAVRQTQSRQPTRH